MAPSAVLLSFMCTDSLSLILILQILASLGSPICGLLAPKFSQTIGL